MKRMGIYLRTKREAKGLTQAQVATQLGYGSPQFISNIERGVSRVPVKSLRSFIDLYSLPTDEVIELLLEEKRMSLKKILGMSDAAPVHENNVTASMNSNS
jgi:transcriptional regulator with XRE-family HTH domain